MMQPAIGDWVQTIHGRGPGKVVRHGGPHASYVAMGDGPVTRFDNASLIPATNPNPEQENR